MSQDNPIDRPSQDTLPIADSPSSASSISSHETQDLSGLQAALQLSTMTSNQKEITLPSGKKTLVDVTQRVSTTTPSSSSIYVRLSSEDRVLLPAKEQAEYAKMITSHQHPKYKTMDLSSENLSDLVSVHTCLETTERHFTQYDLMDTFYIIEPDKDPSTGEFLPSYSSRPALNLFKDYASLTLEKVIASTQWYATFPIEVYHKENMALTAQYLRAHTQAGLLGKLNSQLRMVPESCRGGPVILFLLIEHLMSSNESTAKTLISRLENIKISSYNGEDVEVVVSHLNAILDRLEAMHYVDSLGQPVSQIPKNLSEIFYQIFQTSSNDKFNEFFARNYVKDQTESLASTTFNSKSWTEPKQIVRQATNLYRQLCLDGSWHGIKQQQSTFPAITDQQQAKVFMSTLHCHNCGGPHFLNQCDKPHDETRIAKNRSQFNKIRDLARGERNKNRNSSSNSNSTSSNSQPRKWPPRPKNRDHAPVTIDGKPHYFHFKTSRWIPVSSQSRGSTHSAGAHSAAPPTTSTPSTQGTTPPSSSVSTLTGATRPNAGARTAFTHLAQELNDTLTRVVRQYQDDEEE